MVEDYLEDYGYKKTEIDKIINSKNLKNINIKKIKEINEFLEDMKIPKDKIIKMTSYFPNLFSYKTEVIISKLLYLETMGYTKEQIKKAFINNPSIISYNNKTYDNKVD